MFIEGKASPQPASISLSGAIWCRQLTLMAPGEKCQAPNFDIRRAASVDSLFVSKARIVFWKRDCGAFFYFYLFIYSWMPPLELHPWMLIYCSDWVHCITTSPSSCDEFRDVDKYNKDLKWRFVKNHCVCLSLKLFELSIHFTTLSKDTYFYQYRFAWPWEYV